MWCAAILAALATAHRRLAVMSFAAETPGRGFGRGGVHHAESNLK
jgi:hypothetical protein